MRPQLVQLFATCSRRYAAQKSLLLLWGLASASWGRIIYRHVCRFFKATPYGRRANGAAGGDESGSGDDGATWLKEGKNNH